MFRSLVVGYYSLAMDAVTASWERTRAETSSIPLSSGKLSINFTWFKWRPFIFHRDTNFSFLAGRLPMMDLLFYSAKPNKWTCPIIKPRIWLITMILLFWIWDPHYEPFVLTTSFKSLTSTTWSAFLKASNTILNVWLKTTKSAAPSDSRRCHWVKSGANRICDTLYYLYSDYIIMYYHKSHSTR